MSTSGSHSHATDPPLASILITTRNRCDETLRAIETSLAQDYPALEVLVIDDASEDGTAEKISASFPQVRLIANTERAGAIVNRNRGFREAKGRYVFQLDDDAYYSQRDIVASVVDQLEEDPTIGAIAIPFTEPWDRRSPDARNFSCTAEGGAEMRSFVGCACAIRRDAALEVGSYREMFVHQGEERDLCIRLQAAGWRIVYGKSAQVAHMISPRRDKGRMGHFSARNTILYEWFNSPFPYTAWRIPIVTVRTIAYKFDLSELPLKFRGLSAGVVDGIRHIAFRRPVPRAVYAAHRRLKSHGPVAWTGRVPPPCTAEPDGVTRNQSP